METIFFTKGHGEGHGFKSYYVVWKLLYVSTNIRPRRFKSYYVVWKLFFFGFVGCTADTFKSYYVVWKLQNIVFKFLYLFCLNRTM